MVTPLPSYRYGLLRKDAPVSLAPSMNGTGLLTKNAMTVRSSFFPRGVATLISLSQPFHLEKEKKD